LHEVLRGHALTAWAAVERGEANPLIDLLTGDERVTSLLPADQVRAVLTSPPDVGVAPELCRRFVAQARSEQADSSR